MVSIVTNFQWGPLVVDFCDIVVTRHAPMVISDGYALDGSATNTTLAGLS